MALRTVGARLTLDNTDYIGKLRQSAAATKDFAGQLDKANKAGHLDAVADRAAIAGIALVGAAGAAVKMRMDFDKSMSGVKAATHAGTDQIDLLRKAAIEAGKSTQYSATEAADAITELSKAGVSTANILGGGLKGALDLAAAGQLDVGEAAETAASAMVQFKLSGKDLPHIADLLAAGAGKAQGSVHDMGEALGQSGLVAAQFGLSVEDTTGTLAAFASSGLMGSDAGTSFKTMLLQLANPAEKTRDLMEELGINAYDATGKFVGITNLAEQLKTKLGGLTQAQRDAAMAQIFGTDAIRAANVLYQQGGAGIQDWIGKVNDAGYAADTARELTNNLAGDLERLKGSLETFAIESGGGATGGLRELTKATDGFIDRLGLLPSGITGTVTVLAALGGATVLGAAGWMKMRRGTADALEELRNTGPAGDKAARGLEKTTKWAGRAAAAFALSQAAAAGLNAAFGQNLNPQVDALGKSLDQWATSGAKSGEAARLLGDDFKHLGYDLGTLDSGFWTGLGNGIAGVTEGVSGLGGVMDESLQHAQERLGAIDGALQSMVQNGQGEQAAIIFSKLAGEAKKSGVTVDELKKGLPGYSAALTTAGTAAGGLATATAGIAGPTDDATVATTEYKTAADAAAGAARGQRDAIASLSNFMKAEADPVFGLIEAQKSLTSAQKDAKKAQDDLEKAIEKHGSKSKEAKAASDKLNEATRNLTGSAIDLQGKVGGLGGSFDGKLTPSMRRTLEAANLTEDQIKNVEGQFKNAKKAADAYDDKYEAKASAPGAKDAKTDLDKAYNAANHFAGPYRATVSISGDKNVGQRLDRLRELQEQLKAGKNISVANAMSKKGFGYAGGGWTGPGQMMDVAGVVHADEFVIKKSSRRKIEAKAPGLLEEMNATGQAPGYALGGLVSWPYRTTAAMTRIPSKAEALSVVVGQFGNWPSSPGAQRGDSGVWRKVLALARSSGLPVHFGNGYRPGDPLWHGSGRADDLMGYNQDALANFFLQRQGQILEMIHRTSKRDYAYTRGKNKGSFNEPLMNAHRNHLHIAMKNGGTITEPVMGVGASGTTYSLGENYQPERVVPNWQGAGGGATSVTLVLQNHGVIASPMEAEAWLSTGIDNLRRKGKI